MSKKEDKSTVEKAAEKADSPMPLEERLARCKSRESARETIADFCKDNDHDPKNYKLSSEALFILASLR